MQHAYQASQVAATAFGGSQSAAGPWWWLNVAECRTEGDGPWWHWEAAAIPSQRTWLHRTKLPGFASQIGFWRLSGPEGRFTMPKTQRPATSDLLPDQSPRQLSIHNVRPLRPWHLHDVAGRKSPSTKRKWVPVRQLWVIEPENFPPSLGASQGKRLWCCLCFQDYRFAFSAKDRSYCQNLKQVYSRKPPWQASALWNPQIITKFSKNAKWQCKPEEGSTWYGEHVVPAKIMLYISMETRPATQSLVAATASDSWATGRGAVIGRWSLRFWYCESALRHRGLELHTPHWSPLGKGIHPLATLPEEGRGEKRVNGVVGIIISLGWGCSAGCRPSHSPTKWRVLGPICSLVGYQPWWESETA